MLINHIPQILKLDISGNPQAWIDYERYAYYASKNRIAWAAGEVECTLRGGTNAATGLRSTFTMNTIIAVKGKMNPKSNDYQKVALTNKTLFGRDGHLCGYCGIQLLSRDLTRDHVIPSSRGGLDIWQNVISACKGCNKQKDDYLLEEIGMKLLFIPYVPNKSEALILRGKRILKDQMEFLMKSVPPHSRLHS